MKFMKEMRDSFLESLWQTRGWLVLAFSQIVMGFLVHSIKTITVTASANRGLVFVKLGLVLVGLCVGFAAFRSLLGSRPRQSTGAGSIHKSNTSSTGSK